MYNWYRITIIEDGEEKTIEIMEKEKIFKERLQFYRNNNITIKKVLKKEIIETWVSVGF